MHYLNFSAERLLPPISKLLDQPFWLDPSDPHHMAAVMQARIAPAGAQLRAWPRATGGMIRLLSGVRLGARRSTASPPRASAPSRRSTRRSPGSSRSWRSERTPCSALSHVVLAADSCSRSAPLGAQAADLVVWWDRGASTREEERGAQRRSSPPSSRRAASRSSLSFLSRGRACRPRSWRRSRPASRPTSPSASGLAYYIATMGLSTIGSSISRTPSATFPTCSIRTRSTVGVLLNAKTGQKALYGLPIGRSTNHIHVWKSLLERAGFTLEDIPKEWEAFWSFWCDQVQPAVRQATGPRRHLGRRRCRCRSRPPTPGSVLPVRGVPTMRTT